MGTKIYKPTSIISEEEKQKIHDEIEMAKNKPLVYDEDSPEMDEDMLKQLKSAARNRNRLRKLKGII